MNRASARAAPSRLSPASRAVAAFEAAWDDPPAGPSAPPPLERFWAENDPDRSVATLKQLIKVDLERRYRLGEAAEAAEYLERFPQLRDDPNQVLSLIYAEYCLREIRGEAPDTQEFCARYADWRDSLVSQLQYHRALSRAAAALPRPRYPEPGEWFENFRLEEILGQGGAARVYLAREEKVGDRPVALKVSADRGSEPRILGLLRHPHIVPVLSSPTDPDSGLRGLCMPYMPGLPLDKVIARLRPAIARGTARSFWDALGESVPEAVAADEPRGAGWMGYPARGSLADGAAWIALKLAQALAYAHRMNTLHRDVKPANVLLTAGDGPQLIDFNLAHRSDVPEEATIAQRGGTLPYMAPEQLLAFYREEYWELVGPQADLYSLGLVLAEMLTGQPPEAPERLRSMEPGQAIHEVLELRSLPRTPLRASNPAIPHALEAIVDRCLQFAPDDRYPDALALADDLQRYLQRRPLRYARNRSASERLRNRLWRARRPLAATALLAVGIGLSAWSQARPDANVQLRGVVRLIQDKQLDAAEDLLEQIRPGDDLARLVPFYQAVAVETRLEQFAAESLTAAERAEKQNDYRNTMQTALTEALGDGPIEQIVPAFQAWKAVDASLAARLTEVNLQTIRLAHDDELCALAQRAAELALALDPSSREAHSARGNTLYVRGKLASERGDLAAALDAFASGLTSFDAAYALDARPGDLDDLKALQEIRNSRARTRILWGEILAGGRSASSAGLAEAYDLARAALDDLEQYEAWSQSPEAKSRFDSLPSWRLDRYKNHHLQAKAALLAGSSALRLNGSGVRLGSNGREPAQIARDHFQQATLPLRKALLFESRNLKTGPGYVGSRGLEKELEGYLTRLEGTL